MVGRYQVVHDIGHDVAGLGVHDDGYGVIASRAVGGVGCGHISLAGREVLVDIGRGGAALHLLDGSTQIVPHGVQFLGVEGRYGAGRGEGFFLGGRVFLLEEGRVVVLVLALVVPCVVPARSHVPAVEDLGEAVLWGFAVHRLEQAAGTGGVGRGDHYELAARVVDGGFDGGEGGVGVLVEIGLVHDDEGRGDGAAGLLGGGQGGYGRGHGWESEFLSGVDAGLDPESWRQHLVDVLALAQQFLGFFLALRQEQYDGAVVVLGHPQGVSGQEPGSPGLSALEPYQQLLAVEYVADLHEVGPGFEGDIAPAGRWFEDPDEGQEAAEVVLGEVQFCGVGQLVEEDPFAILYRYHSPLPHRSRVWR